ncbi:extensin-like protein [Rhodotorula toruloides]|uniref:Extensin-like protein n=1 Tax=Rhodotorula toruloides TaxID=5286 RepID=A0A511KHQ5_RHOTO|nr:extensin-like protein [Rhodotorula toruloides]
MFGKRSPHFDVPGGYQAVHRVVTCPVAPVEQGLAPAGVDLLLLETGEWAMDFAIVVLGPGRLTCDRLVVPHEAKKKKRRGKKGRQVNKDADLEVGAVEGGGTGRVIVPSLCGGGPGGASAAAAAGTYRQLRVEKPDGSLAFTRPRGTELDRSIAAVLRKRPAEILDQYEKNSRTKRQKTAAEELKRLMMAEDDEEEKGNESDEESLAGELARRRTSRNGLRRTKRTKNLSSSPSLLPSTRMLAQQPEKKPALDLFAAPPTAPLFPPIKPFVFPAPAKPMPAQPYTVPSVDPVVVAQSSSTLQREADVWPVVAGKEEESKEPTAPCPAVERTTATDHAESVSVPDVAVTVALASTTSAPPAPLPRALPLPSATTLPTPALPRLRRAPKLFDYLSDQESEDWEDVEGSGEQEWARRRPRNGRALEGKMEPPELREGEKDEEEDGGGEKVKVDRDLLPSARARVDKLIPTSYQNALLERAKKGNLITVLRTGSGKTLVAVLLIEWQHKMMEEEHIKAGQPKRMQFFLTNSVPLVHQQANTLACNTSLGNSFKSFFFGSRPTKESAAPVRRPSRKERRANRPKTTDTAIDPHFPTLLYLGSEPPRPAALRQSKLLLVDKYARDDRIAAWQEQRNEEVGGLEKWRTQVAKEVAWEKAIMEDGRVGAAVEELSGMLNASAFSTAFTVDSLRLPPSPDQPPTTPPKDALRAAPATFLELDEVDEVQPLVNRNVNRTTRTTVVLDTTIELAPPPLTPKTFTPPLSALPPAWSVPPPAPSPYRFPAPPSPNYPNLVRLDTPSNTPLPTSVLTSSIEPGHWIDSPPPRTTSLPFGDLLQVSAHPPECSIVPPMAAALLGLFASTTVAGIAPLSVPIAQEARKPASARPLLCRFDSADVSDRKYSMETSSASLQTGDSIFSAHATAPLASRPSCSSSSAPTSANASIDLKHPLFPPRSSSFAHAVKSSFAPKRKAPPGLSSLKLRKEGMSSLPDLHSAGLSATPHKSIRRDPPQAWLNWRHNDHNDDEQESLID